MGAALRHWPNVLVDGGVVEESNRVETGAENEGGVYIGGKEYRCPKPGWRTPGVLGFEIFSCFPRAA